MHLVVKGEIPARLLQLEETETPKWVAHYALPREKRGSKPKGQWTEASVRSPLRADFLDCCCYCGIGLGEAKARGAIL